MKRLGLMVVAVLLGFGLVGCVRMPGVDQYEHQKPPALTEDQ
jgi:hypothetical protein